MMNDMKKHILIVEDSTDLQELLARILGRQGYTVSRAYNGQQGLDALRTMPELPAFILLDLMMPVMDGFGFRQEQRKDPRLASIPVVVMTADSDPEIKSQQLGAHSFFRKPLLDVANFLEVAKALTRSDS